MGLLKAYLNALPDEARDRVLTAQNWTWGRAWRQTGARCLVGHAEDFDARGGHDQQIESIRLTLRDRYPYGPATACRFDRLVRRRGLAAAVALVKRHAGARVPEFAPGELVG